MFSLWRYVDDWGQVLKSESDIICSYFTVTFVVLVYSVQCTLYTRENGNKRNSDNLYSSSLWENNVNTPGMLDFLKYLSLLCFLGFKPFFNPSFFVLIGLSRSLLCLLVFLPCLFSVRSLRSSSFSVLRNC